ncbi:MAG: LysR family transcriptional regulator [Oscillospiraceae bacterium]|nr:LysR family transcriptional regulator [Oscillospiraceae bacterium]MCI9402798.1 LysR family transcriptional regulator [Oscillospiraceae bacterium]
MRVEQLRHFVILSEELNYLAAAERLYISQPSLSKSIQAIERELGVQLVNRGTRHVSLTDTGLTFLEHAKRICREYEQAMEELRGKKAAHMVVEVMPLTFQEEIADMLADFSQDHSEIHMRILEKENQETVARLKRGEIDLAIMRYEGEDEQLRVIPMFSNRIILAVGRNHPLAGRNAVSLAEVGEETFLAFNKGSEMYKKSMELLSANGVSPELQGSEVRVNTMKPFIEKKRMVAILTDNMIDDDDPGIRKLAIAGDPKLTISIVLRRGKSRPELEQFLDFAQQYFPKLE